MATFLEVQPSAENRWRAIILLGRNTASYKFALAQALLELNREPGDLVKLEELALPFARALSRHVRDAPKQGARGINRTLKDACEGFNAGELSEEGLRDAAVRHGFGDVIDAFHVLGSNPITERFFLDERNTAKGIKITDEMCALGQARLADLSAEVEARWRVVETGWDLGVAPSLIEFDRETGNLTLRSADRRLALRSCVSTLNGYQKGRCFYCFTAISTEPGPLLADVDHLFPWSLRNEFPQADGIWNLVLACKHCNRGVAGKFDAIPALQLVERLSRRNEFYVASKHKLAQTILAQTGVTSRQRTAFLQTVYDTLVRAGIQRWEPPLRGEPAF